MEKIPAGFKPVVRLHTKLNDIMFCRILMDSTRYADLLNTTIDTGLGPRTVREMFENYFKNKKLKLWSNLIAFKKESQDTLLIFVNEKADICNIKDALKEIGIKLIMDRKLKRMDILRCGEEIIALEEGNRT